MTAKPTVSVIVATYNMADYVGLAVRSILAQTYRDLEVLVVDDGSTDNTQQVVKPLLADSRVRYLVQENRGQPAAENRGLSASTGELIAFLDADDLWVPEKLELQIPLFSSSKSLGVVYSRLKYIDSKGEYLSERTDNYPTFRGRVTNELLIRNFIRFGSAVVRRECFDRLGFFNEGLTLGNDYELWLRLSTQYEFDFIDRPLLAYRVWPGQMTRSCKPLYVSGIQIMESFLRGFPGAVDKGTEREAWAYTYAGFGACLMREEGNVLSALKLFLKALSYKPTYIPAWSALLKSIRRG